jgi:hypothetical protein
MQTFSEYLEALIIRHGSQAGVAAVADVDPAKISRFRSDQIGLTRADIDKLLTAGGAAIATEGETNRYEATIAHLAALWLRERTRKEETK